MGQGLVDSASRSHQLTAPARTRDALPSHLIHKFAILGCVATCAIATSATAQVPSFEELTAEEQARLDAHLKEGLEHYASGDFDDALDQFERAYAIFGHPDVRFKIAQCKAKLGRTREAIADYKDYASRVSPEERDKIQSTIRELERALPGRLVISTKPDAANVFVGGELRGTTPAELEVSGEVELRIAREGFADVRQRVDISPGESLSIDLTLAPTSSSKSAPPIMSDASPMERGALITAGVGGVGAIGFGAAFLIQHNKLAKIRETEMSRTPEYDRGFYRRNAFGTLAISGLVIAAAGGAVWGYFRQEASKSPAPRGENNLRACAPSPTGIMCAF